MARSGRLDVPQSQVSPAFLHANSTSHTWPFSAIAEIIDNAYDPDVSASQLFIDVEENYKEQCLVFMDNGNGMTPDKLYKMLSFGYCEKVEINGHKPVGHYGNGFKSGSMRLGKDAIVFTKVKQGTMSVGFLSQTYLHSTGAETVLIPMVTWHVRTKAMVIDDYSNDSLKAITQHSIFTSEKALLREMMELDAYESGTRIIIYNLKRSTDGRLELDFISKSDDIINSERQELDFSSAHRPVMDHIPEYRKSLREYCSILFLKPRMKIILRQQKVKTRLISKSLSRMEKDYYKPVYLNKPVKIIFGFSKSVEDFGLMMYYRNRLIKAYEHVGCQRKANDEGVGVVGIVEVDFLEPIHNKQDFKKTDRYNAFINAASLKLNDYWRTKTYPGRTSEERSQIDWTWVQCDGCLKWRRLPDGFTDEGLPDKWFCYMNPDPTHNRCDIEEEPEDEDELRKRASYNKVKKKCPSDLQITPITMECVIKDEMEQRHLVPSLQENQMQNELWQSQVQGNSRAGRRSTNLIQNILGYGQQLQPLPVKEMPDNVNQIHVLNGPLRKKRRDSHVVACDDIIDVEPEDVIDLKADEEDNTKLQCGNSAVSNAEHNWRKQTTEYTERGQKNSSASSQGSAQDNRSVHGKHCKIAESEQRCFDKQTQTSLSECTELSTKAVQSNGTTSVCCKCGKASDCADSKDDVELLQQKLEVMTSKLTGLRSNVYKLLQTITTDLKIDNLEYIDPIVAGMVRVNGQNN